MQRIYGPPPNAPRRRNEPRVPRSVTELRAASRRPRFVASVVGGLLAFGLVIVMLVAVFSPPPPPPLNEPGEPFNTAVVGFDKPGFWVPWTPSDTLEEPIVIFAPQAETADAPTTMTIDAINVTDDVTELLGPEGENALSTLELLNALVSKWATEANRGPYELAETSYNVVDAESGLALSGVIVRWADGAAWTPLPIDDPATRPSVTPAPSLAPGVVPTATPDPTPTPVPSAVPGVEMFQWQMIGLPTDRKFTADGQRLALTVTLTWPSTLSADRVEQAQEAFLGLVASLRVGE